MKSTPEQRRERLVYIGTALYGALFQKSLAAALGVSQQLISHIVKGIRGVSDDLDRRLAVHAASVLDERRAALEMVAQHVLAITQEHGMPTVTKSSAVPVAQTEAPPRPRKLVMPQLRKREPEPAHELDDEAPEMKP